MTIEELESAALRLSEHERDRLATLLIASLSTDGPWIEQCIDDEDSASWPEPSGDGEAEPGEAGDAGTQTAHGADPVGSRADGERSGLPGAEVGRRPRRPRRPRPDGWSRIFDDHG